MCIRDSFSAEFRTDLANRNKVIYQIYCEGKVSENTIYLGCSFDGGGKWEELDIDLTTLKHYEISGGVFKVRRYLSFGSQGKIARFRVRTNTMTEQVEIHKLKAEVMPTSITGE